VDGTVLGDGGPVVGERALLSRPAQESRTQPASHASSRRRGPATLRPRAREWQPGQRTHLADACGPAWCGVRRGVGGCPRSQAHTRGQPRSRTSAGTLARGDQSASAASRPAGEPWAATGTRPTAHSAGPRAGAGAGIHGLGGRGGANGACPDQARAVRVTNGIGMDRALGRDRDLLLRSPARLRLALVRWLGAQAGDRWPLPGGDQRPRSQRARDSRLRGARQGQSPGLRALWPRWSTAGDLGALGSRPASPRSGDAGGQRRPRRTGALRVPTRARGPRRHDLRASPTLAGPHRRGRTARRRPVALRALAGHRRSTLAPLSHEHCGPGAREHDAQ